MSLKICYIGHPISGDVMANLNDIRRIVRQINLEFPEIVPFVPYYVDIVSLDDSIPEERERGIANDKAILESGMVQEMWLTGDRISNGMREEIILAAVMSIPVKNMMERFAVKETLLEEDEQGNDSSL